MFRQTKAFSGFSVNDIPAAQAFYAETLGLEVAERGTRCERYGDDQDELGIARDEGPPIAWSRTRQATCSR